MVLVTTLLLLLLLRSSRRLFVRDGDGMHHAGHNSTTVFANCTARWPAVDGAPAVEVVASVRAAARRAHLRRKSPRLPHAPSHMHTLIGNLQLSPLHCVLIPRRETSRATTWCLSPRQCESFVRGRVHPQPHQSNERVRDRKVQPVLRLPQDAVRGHGRAVR